MIYKVEMVHLSDYEVAADSVTTDISGTLCFERDGNPVAYMIAPGQWVACYESEDP